MASSTSSEDNGHQFRIEEWKILRDEISRKQQLNHKIIFSTLGLNFLLYSYLLLQKQEHNWMDSFIALLPVFIVGIANYWHLKNDHSAYRITIYIRNFLESEDDNASQFNWETALRSYINQALNKTRQELSLLNSVESGFWNFLSSLWKRIKKNFSTIFFFTGIPLLFKTNNKIPREVDLMLNAFYYFSPLIAALILIQVESKPSWLDYNFLIVFFIFLGFSWLIYSIWAFTIIKIGQREINILHIVSNKIEEKGLVAWQKEIDDWKKSKSEKDS